ncbi:MAG: cytochrome ubiquinol oxidase subunit I, partial [Shewanella sp.]
HTVASGYVTGAMFILAISSYYILKKRDLPFARRSFAIAASFGMASILSVIVLGDESGYKVGEAQRVKLAAIEAEWHTEPAPAAFTAVGFPNQETMHTDFAVKIPYAMGIVATRSLDEEVTGIRDLITEHEVRIRNGMKAYEMLVKLRAGDTSPELRTAFEAAKIDLGYGLLLKRYTDNVVDATEEQIKAAAKDSIPSVAPMFWSFRIMVGLGFVMLFVFAAAFWQSTRHQIEEKKWVLKAALYSLPLPWIAIECGWFVAEYGRQPWTISEVLPTFMSASSLTTGDLWFSIISITLFYSVLLIIEMFLMFKFARLGPSSLKTGRYHFEKLEA